MKRILLIAILGLLSVFVAYTYMKIPDDAGGDAMRRVIKDGSDTSRPMDIDFMISCPTEKIAQTVAALAEAKGYAVRISKDSDDSSFTCYCTKSMLLAYTLLIAAQQELDQAAQPHGARIDGWGTFGNRPEKP